jgi:hypothetical protein
MLIIASIIILLGILFGAPIYYYKYNRNDMKASISKNPNYGLFGFYFNLILIIYCRIIYT